MTSTKQSNPKKRYLSKHTLHDSLAIMMDSNVLSFVNNHDISREIKLTRYFCDFRSSFERTLLKLREQFFESYSNDFSIAESQSVNTKIIRLDTNKKVFIELNKKCLYSMKKNYMFIF